MIYLENNESFVNGIRLPIGLKIEILLYELLKKEYILEELIWIMEMKCI